MGAEDSETSLATISMIRSCGRDCIVVVVIALSCFSILFRVFIVDSGGGGEKESETRTRQRKIDKERDSLSCMLRCYVSFIKREKQEQINTERDRLTEL